MKWLEQKCRKSSTFAWILTAAGIVVMVLIGFAR